MRLPLPPVAVLHGRGAILTLAAVAIAAVILALAGAQQRGNNVVIAVEHDGPLTLRIRALAREEAGTLIEFDHDSMSGVRLSVPSDWDRDEVRGAPLPDFRAEPPALGFIRWMFPPRSGMTFRVPAPLAHVRLHHASSAPIQVKLTRVDLARTETAYDATLIQGKEQQLW